MDGIHRALTTLIALRYGKRDDGALRGQGGPARDLGRNPGTNSRENAPAQLPLDIKDLANPRPKRTRRATRPSAAAPSVSKTPPKVDRSRTLVWSSADLGRRVVRFRPEADRGEVPMEIEAIPTGRPSKPRSGGPTGPLARSSLLHWFNERVGACPSARGSIEYLGSSGSSSSAVTLSDLMASSRRLTGGSRDSATAGGGPVARLTGSRKPVSFRATTRSLGIPTLADLLREAQPVAPGGSLKHVPIARGVLDPAALRH